MVRMAVLLVALLGLALLVPFRAHATDHVVGDGSGWTFGVNYDSWASSKTFVPGDTLTFNYGPSHSVLRVSKSDYDSCGTGNALTSDRSGTTKVTLSKPATTYYFICGTPSHCPSGMKVAVTTPSGGGGGSSSRGGGDTTPSTGSSDDKPSTAGTNGPRLIVAALVGLGLGLGLVVVG